MAYDSRRRRSPWPLIGVLALGAAILVGWMVWTGGMPGDAEGDASTGPPAEGVPPRPAEAFALTVNYVFDGDTIEATMVAPNEIVTTSNPIRIRLIGIDTPEGTPTPECWADEARAHLSELLPEGATVWAAPDSDTWDHYQRRLFNLWTDDGRFVNHELVAAGDAEAIRVWPNVRYDDLLGDAQRQAEASGTGQWGACG